MSQRPCGLLPVALPFHLTSDSPPLRTLLKKLALLLVLAALVLAACGGGSNAVAATVNGEDITVGDIEALIDTGEQSTIPKQTFAQFLGFDIQWRIVSDAAEDEFEIV